MRDNLVSIRCAVAFGAFMLLALASSANAKEVYTGTVIGVGGPLGGVSRPFTLEINSYTSKAESSRAVAVLAEGGQDRLLKELEGKRLGYFSLGGQLGRDLNFVQETRAADGRRRTGSSPSIGGRSTFTTIRICCPASRSASGHRWKRDRCSSISTATTSSR